MKTDLKVGASLLGALTTAALVSGCAVQIKTASTTTPVTRATDAQAAPVLTGQQSAAYDAVLQSDLSQVQQVAAAHAATGAPAISLAELQEDGIRVSQGTVIDYTAAAGGWCIAVYNPLATRAKDTNHTYRIANTGTVAAPGQPGDGACAGHN